jgi:hypothetical protein
MPSAPSRPSNFFWGIFLVLGLSGTVIFAATMIWPAIRVNFFYKETVCTVLDKRVAEGEDNTFRPEIHIEYRVGNQVHRAWTYDATGVYSNLEGRKDVLNEFVVGQQYPCWYDPTTPEKSVLVRRSDPWSLIILIPLVFVAVGAGGLLSNRRAQTATETPEVLPAETMRRMIPLRWVLILGFLEILLVVLAFYLGQLGMPMKWILIVLFVLNALFFSIAFFALRPLFPPGRQTLPSPERTAATGDHKQSDWAPSDQDLPTVPEGRPPIAGRILAASLSREPSGICGVGCLILFAALWIGAVSVMGYRILSAYGRGESIWMQTLFLIPFAVVALVLIGVIVNVSFKELVSLLVGRVETEVSAYPIQVGGRYRVCVFQATGAALRDVTVHLVCSESATYTAGTNTSTARREVLRVATARLEGDPLQGQFATLNVPASAMHSFEAKHNKVEWQVEVTGRAWGLPWRGLYAIVVHPAAVEA